MRKRSTAVASGIMLACLLGGLLSGIGQAPAAQAATASNFDPGHIIEDQLFFNGSIMSESSVQTFLQNKETSCAPTTGRPGCLKDFRSDARARGADKYCQGAYAGGTAQLASTIIYNVAIACNINAQVLLVTLQKEQTLVTSSNPSAGAYKLAMGLGCPDSAPCDSLYYGFENQVYGAARQFQAYRVLGSSYWKYYAGVTAAIGQYPEGTAYNNVNNARCGTQTVHIQNAATAALYLYTPYVPNAAALANLYGGGDSCSTYGNRNFWRDFTDWFGSTTVSQPAAAFVKALYADVLGRTAGDTETTGWGQQLMNGVPPYNVAAGFIDSDEYRLIRINAAYKTILGRSAEPGGAQGWLDAMKRGILQTDDVDKVFLSTGEYLTITGGTNETFVAALYQRLIGRAAIPDEVSGWSAVAASSGRRAVVDAIWSSRETARSRVSLMYESYLGRAPEAAGLDGWATIAIEQGDARVRWAIIGSSEYWTRASVRFPAPN